MGAETELVATDWPASVPVDRLEGRVAQALKGEFLTGGLVLLLADVLAALWVAGRLSGLRRGAAVLLLAAVVADAQSATAQDGTNPPASDAEIEALLESVGPGRSIRA